MSGRTPSVTLPASGHVHIVGAGGAGMAPLATILRGLGYTVTGSDLKPARSLELLGDHGITTWVGHRPDRIPVVDLLVASSAVPTSDPEVKAAVAAGVPVWPRPLLLEALTAAYPALGFAGTHGKTTSTALAVHALRSVGEDPTFIVGGEMVGLNTGAHLGDRDLFALEADEAFGTFRHLFLSGLAVTNIEADHLDYYESVAALEEAFALVANRVDGPVVGCIDDPGVRRLARRAAVAGYGTSPEARWRMVDIRHATAAVSFTLLCPDGEVVDVAVPLPGEHVARNAAGVLALLGESGRDVRALAAGMAGFRGVRRRFEVRGTVGGVTVVDDYAHHPTEIAATIDAGRRGGWEAVRVVFQPHRYSRTADLAPEFGVPLAAADDVIVTDVYAAGEAPLPGVTGRLVAEATEAAGGAVRYVPDLAAAVMAAAESAEPGDVVLLLGAGDVTGAAEPLLEHLEQRALEGRV